jgi:hypothetical protein
MDLAFITPTAFLDRYSSKGNLYLALAHLIDDDGTNDYARFHRRKAREGARVILDNGLFEGAQVNTDSLLRRARAINASVVCAPDVLYNAEGTIKEFKQFIRDKQDFGFQCDVMGIPQADNPTDWWTCFRFMDMSADCQLIGLSILSIPQAFEHVAGTGQLNRSKPFSRITDSRMYLLRQLCSYEELLGRRATDCHLLGLGEHYGDLLYAANSMSETIISNDSSSAFVHGMHNVRYTGLGDIPGGKILEKLDFSLQTSTIGAPQDEAIVHNIDIALRLAHGFRR